MYIPLTSCSVSEEMGYSWTHREYMTNRVIKRVNSAMIYLDRIPVTLFARCLTLGFSNTSVLSFPHVKSQDSDSVYFPYRIRGVSAHRRIFLSLNTLF